jgi:hypothetical protein
MPKRILIQCPRCHGTLEFNLDMGKVERHWEKRPDGAGAGADFDALIDRAKRRSAEDLPDITRTLEEQQRRRDVEFERAKRKLKEEEAGSPPSASPG